MGRRSARRGPITGGQMTRDNNLMVAIKVAAVITGLIVLLAWALINIADSALPRDYEFRPRDEVKLVFNAGEFVPAGGVTAKGNLRALRVDDNGFAICSPTVRLEIVPREEKYTPPPPEWQEMIDGIEHPCDTDPKTWVGCEEVK